ncbi:MAG: EpsG family protein [Pseudomonadota bacterium]
MMAAVVLLALFVARTPELVVEHAGIRNDFPRTVGNVLVIVLCLLIGLRPINYAFGDMGTYYKHFVEYAGGASLEGKDLIFEGLMWLFAQVNAPGLFFLFCALVYLLPLRIASKRVLGNYWSLGFVFLAAHVSFYGFAVNGIRNGMAMSVFTLALTMPARRAWSLMALAVGLHGSLILPAMAYMAASFGFKARWAIAFWVICLVVSLTMPGVAVLLAAWLPVDGRLQQYAAIGNEYDDQFSSTGFRWDFLLYGALPILVGWYFIFKKKRFDRFYLRLFITYVIANAFWLLLITLPFSNRFAYLSWGIMGLVYAYPLIKWKIFVQQHVVFVLLLLGVASFSYVSQL